MPSGTSWTEFSANPNEVIRKDERAHCPEAARQKTAMAQKLASLACVILIVKNGRGRVDAGGPNPASLAIDIAIGN